MMAFDAGFSMVIVGVVVEEVVGNGVVVVVVGSGYFDNMLVAGVGAVSWW